MSVRDVVIVGAGPSGLSAAIACKQRSLDYQVLEQGVLVNSIYRFPPQMVFFTTPELLEIGGLPFMSPYDKPTRAEALKYYRKVVDAYDLQICCDEQVLAIEREPTLKPSIKCWVRPDIENRIKEGSIAAQFSAVVREIRPTSVVVAPCGAYTAAIEADVPVPPDGSAGYVAPTRSGPASEQEIPADAVYLLTGYRADTDLMVRAGIELTARHGPVHDPQTFETNVPGLFVAGGAIAGVDTGTIFIENGRFHGEKIVEVIARRG